MRTGLQTRCCEFQTAGERPEVGSSLLTQGQGARTHGPELSTVGRNSPTKPKASQRSENSAAAQDAAQSGRGFSLDEALWGGGWGAGGACFKP